jgi:Protein of unknown function (DUF4079)
MVEGDTRSIFFTKKQSQSIKVTMRILLFLAAFECVSSFTTITTTSTTFHRPRVVGSARVVVPLPSLSSSSVFRLRAENNEDSLVDVLPAGDADDAIMPSQNMILSNLNVNSGGAMMMVNAFVVANMIPLMANAAAGPDWGIFEGRILSLMHPITMFSLLAYSIATAILGFQWRRQRTMGDEIAMLKSQLPKETVTTTADTAVVVPKSAAVLALETQINDLQKERKDLASANPRDKHYSQGALLAFIGTAFAIEVR